MKLKNKFYIIQLFISITFISLFVITYNSYIKQKQNDLLTTVKVITQNNKLFIEQSLQSIYKEYQNKQKLFYNIHQYTQNQFAKNKNQNLQTLKEEIKEHFHIEDMDIDLYIIDKTYTITHSTFKKDIGFNLSVIEDAKSYLDKTKKDNKTYVASNISIDMLDSNLNVYSYSKINDNQYFEMGFKFKNPLYKNLKHSLDNIYQSTNNKITIYRVIDTADKKEFYDNVLKETSVNISKKEYEKSLQKFDKNKPTTDKHINAIRFNKTYDEIVENKFIVYVPLLQKNANQHLFYNNILMKIEIDITEYLTNLSQTKQYFYIFGIVVFILLFILYYFVKYNFYKPMIKVTKIFETENKVEDSTLLNKKDEFGILVEKYNSLFDKLSKEITLNQNLLEENKRFIADTVHQIRTPLTNIMMNGEILKEFQNEESQSFIDQIDASVNMLSNSYEDLAYVTTSDTFEYKANYIIISELLTKRIKFFSTISKVNFKDIVPNIQNNIHIHINHIELERIIDNNISNGIKYGADNKPITISLSESNDRVILQFKTFGEPIKNVEKIFERSYRENEAKRGLGLGLNMVKGICEKYDITYSVIYKDGQNIFTYEFKGNK